MSVENARALLVTMQAELSQALAELATPPPPPTIPVKPGDNLLTVLAAAPAGATLQIDPAFVFTGDLVLAQPVTLVSSAPPPLARVGESLVGPTIKGTVTVTGAAVSLIGLWIAGTVKEQTLLTTGPGTVVDRCVLLGSPAGQHRGVCANSAGVRIARSYIANIWAEIDTQAIAGWSGCRDLVVDDCYLEASGETVIFGGSDNASALLNPQDLVLSNCTITKNLAWKTQPGVTCKNLIELKNAQGVHIVNCTCSNAWLSGQDGYGLVLTVRNQDGGNPWANVTDVVIADCTFAHLGAGINILGTDDTHPSGLMARVTIERCQFTDINPPVWGGSGREVLIAGGPQALELLNCTFSGAGENSAITFGGTVASNTLAGLQIGGCQFDEGDYGIQGDAAPSLGIAALALYAPGYLWSLNTIVKGTSGRTIAYPPGTTLV